jgi:hypothetical protein
MQHGQQRIPISRNVRSTAVLRRTAGRDKPHVLCSSRRPAALLRIIDTWPPTTSWQRGQQLPYVRLTQPTAEHHRGAAAPQRSLQWGWRGRGQPQPAASALRCGAARSRNARLPQPGLSEQRMDPTEGAVYWQDCHAASRRPLQPQPFWRLWRVDGLVAVALVEGWEAVTWRSVSSHSGVQWPIGTASIPFHGASIRLCSASQHSALPSSRGVHVAAAHRWRDHLSHPVAMRRVHEASFLPCVFHSRCS